MHVNSTPIDNSAPFFSRHSHRLIICFLLLLANYFGLANSMGMSTAVVCMVNSTLVVDKFNGNADNLACSAAHENNLEDELAIPGTMDWSPAQQSLLLSAKYYGIFLTVAFSGIVADRLGPDLVLTGVLVLSSAITLATPLLAFTSYQLLVGSRVLMGAIEALHTPSINCLVASWFARGEKAFAAAISSTGYQFAAGFSSLFAASLCRSSLLRGWPSIFYVFGGSCIVFSVFWMIFGWGGPSRNHWVNERERTYLQNISRKTNTQEATRPAPIARILLALPVHSVLLCELAYSFTTTIMHAYLPLFLRDLGLPIETIGWYTLTPFLAQIPGKTLFGLLINYCASKQIISLTTAAKLAQSMGSFGAAISLICIAIFPKCANSTTTLYILIAFGVVYSGGACGSAQPTLDLASKHGHARISIGYRKVNRIAAVNDHCERPHC